MHTNDYANKLFISSDKIDYDMAENLQRLLGYQNLEWLKITAPSWKYQNPTNALLLHFE